MLWITGRMDSLAGSGYSRRDGRASPAWPGFMIAAVQRTADRLRCSYQRPCPLTAFVRQGRWYLIDLARGRPTNPARIPVGRPGRWYQSLASVMAGAALRDVEWGVAGTAVAIASWWERPPLVLPSPPAPPVAPAPAAPASAAPPSGIRSGPRRCPQPDDMAPP